MLAWEFFKLRLMPGSDDDEAKTAWNKLPLLEVGPLFENSEFCLFFFFFFVSSQRQPFLAEAREAAELQLARPAVRRRASAYQFFISSNYDAFSAQHPELTLPQLTAAHLAPAWQKMTSEERLNYELLATEDYERFEREKAEEPPAVASSLLETAKTTADTVSTAPLSGQGLFLVANWDASDKADPVRRWVELGPSEQLPWKVKASQNQKTYALQALRTRKAAAAAVAKKKSSKKRVEREE